MHSIRYFLPFLLVIAILPIAIAFANGLLSSFGDNPQFSFTLAGSFAIYMATRPTRRELAITILIGFALRFEYGAIIGVKPYFGSELISLAGFMGIASLIVLGYSATQNKNLSVLGAAAFFPYVTILVGFILPITSRLSPVTFDSHLLAVDATFGFQPSFVLGQLIRGRPFLRDIFTTVYYALPLPVAMLCAAAVKNEHMSEVRRLLSLFGVLSVVGFFIYAVCPATGPAYAFHECFPMKPPHLPDISLAPLSVPNAPRNAMPSLHLCAALLVFWNTSIMHKATRIAAGFFLAGTAFAILALGEHYLIDIITAVPFALMFQATFTKPSIRNFRWKYGAMIGSTGFVALWLIMLRFRIQPLVLWPAITYFISISTLGFSFFALHELSRRNPICRC